MRTRPKEKENNGWRGFVPRVLLVRSNEPTPKPHKPPAMFSDKTKTRLHSVFASLDSDVSFDVAFALSDKINEKTGLSSTYQDVIHEYENWQSLPESEESNA
jgi:hypothetical protein